MCSRSYIWWFSFFNGSPFSEKTAIRAPGKQQPPNWIYFIIIGVDDEHSFSYWFSFLYIFFLSLFYFWKIKWIYSFSGCKFPDVFHVPWRCQRGARWWAHDPGPFGSCTSTDASWHLLLVPRKICILIFKKKYSLTPLPFCSSCPFFHRPAWWTWRIPTGVKDWATLPSGPNTGASLRKPSNVTFLC